MAEVKSNLKLESFCKELGMTPKNYLFSKYKTEYTEDGTASLYLSDKKIGLFVANQNFIIVSCSSVYNEASQNWIVGYHFSDSIMSRSKKKSWRLMGSINLESVPLKDTKNLKYQANLARSLVKRLAKVIDTSNFIIEFNSLMRSFWRK